MTLPYDKVKCFKLHTKLDIDMVYELRKAAKSEGVYVSQLVRRFLENGLKEINGSQT